MPKLPLSPACGLSAATDRRGRFSPERRTAEFFGLWGMTYKFAGMGVLGFGLVRAFMSHAAALALLTAFFVVGLALLLRVNETAGVRAAKRVDRDYRRP